MRQPVKFLFFLSFAICLFTFLAGYLPVHFFGRLSVIPVHATYNPNLSFPEAEFVPNEIIIKYKSNQAPDQLRTQIFEREAKRKTIIGSFQIFGYDLVAKITRQGTPEENLASQQKLKSRFKVFKEEKIFETNNQNVLGATTQENLLTNYYLLKSTQVNVNQAVQEFTKQKTVEFAEPNYIYHIMATPNDPYYSYLWGMKKIQAPTAWDITTGSESVTVAVIDTGVNYNHEDFDPGLIIKGPNFIYGTDDPMDDNGHGTHVTGTIGAIGNNSVGVVGLNWRIKIMAIKVLDYNGDGTLSTIAQGIQYAADHGADVANMSVGGSSGSNTLKEAVKYAHSQGVVLVGAAGNCKPTCAVIYPARYPEVIAVAATDSSDQRASFSSYGNTVEVAAPGVSILSTYRSSYSYLQGTSMASPHAAGLAALILAGNPALTPDQVREILTSTTDDLGLPGKDSYYGYGRINAARALGTSPVTPTPTSITTTPTPTPTPGNPTTTPTPTLSPTPTPDEPTLTPTATLTPALTISPTPTSTPAPGKITSLKIEIMLQGISSQKEDKKFNLKIKSSDKKVVKTENFSSDNQGIYSGTINLVEEDLESGIFDILIKTNYFLQKKFAGISLGAGENTLTRLANQDLLKAGDINNSGVVDQEDVNLLKVAYSPFNLVSDPVDLNLDNLVNSLDYSLLVSNLNQSDENGPTPTLTPIATVQPTLTLSLTPTRKRSRQR